MTTVTVTSRLAHGQLHLPHASRFSSISRLSNVSRVATTSRIPNVAQLSTASKKSPITQVLDRTARVLRDSTVKVLQMRGTDPLPTRPLPLFLPHTPVATGCDADVGGLSTVHWAIVREKGGKGSASGAAAESEEVVIDAAEAEAEAESRGEFSSDAATAPQIYGKFWGEMRLDVRPELKGRVRGGYAGVRSQPQWTLFGTQMYDLSEYQYLALRVRAGGAVQTRQSYYVNMQTDGPVSTDLWQHRLYLQGGEGEWEDVFLPLDKFVLTNSGEVVGHEVQMMRRKVRTVGVSMLGGKSGISGRYELSIANMRAERAER